MSKKIENTDSIDKHILHHNVNMIILYSLSTAVALGFNDLMLSIFNSFNNKNNIIRKIIYVITICTVTILFAYYVHYNIK